MADVAPEILFQVDPSEEDCHCIVPVEPDKLNEVLLPSQIVVLATEAVPATLTGLTVILEEKEDIH